MPDAGSASIGSTQGVLAVLVATVAFWFWVESATGWRLFRIFPPLLFIYATPVLLNNTGVLPTVSPVYTVLRELALPVFLCLMLLGVDVAAAIRLMGRGVAVMLIGTLGVIVGGVVGYAAVHRWLDPQAWKAFGALAASWIGGTGNMAAVAGGLDTPADQFGLAVLADNVVSVVWLPLLLASRAYADGFARWARVDPERVARLDAAALAEAKEERAPRMRDYAYLGCLATLVAWAAAEISARLPVVEPILSRTTWEILAVTTLALALSLTRARRIPGSHELAMALVYVFVAGMGARASLAGLAQAPAFLLGAFIWIAVHGVFTLAGAWLLRVDVHSAAIASAANIGGVASAPIVAAAHRESLVPASILMALIGYAIGNYGALITARLCHWVGAGG